MGNLQLAPKREDHLLRGIPVVLGTVTCAHQTGLNRARDWTAIIGEAINWKQSEPSTAASTYPIHIQYKSQLGPHTDWALLTLLSALLF